MILVLRMRFRGIEPALAWSVPLGHEYIGLTDYSVYNLRNNTFYFSNMREVCSTNVFINDRVISINPVVTKVADSRLRNRTAHA